MPGPASMSGNSAWSGLARSGGVARRGVARGGAVAVGSVPDSEVEAAQAVATVGVASPGKRPVPVVVPVPVAPGRWVGAGQAGKAGESDQDQDRDGCQPDRSKPTAARRARRLVAWLALIRQKVPHEDPLLIWRSPPPAMNNGPVSRSRGPGTRSGSLDSLHIQIRLGAGNHLPQG